MRRFRWLAAAVVGVALGVGCGSDEQTRTDTPRGKLAASPDTFAAVKRVLEPRRDELMALPGVVGTAIGATNAAESERRPVLPSERVHVVVVYLRSSDTPAPPASIGGIPVKPVVTGEIRAE